MYYIFRTYNYISHNCNLISHFQLSLLTFNVTIGCITTSQKCSFSLSIVTIYCNCDNILRCTVISPLGLYISLLQLYFSELWLDISTFHLIFVIFFSYNCAFASQNLTLYLTLAILFIMVDLVIVISCYIYVFRRIVLISRNCYYFSYLWLL